MFDFLIFLGFNCRVSNINAQRVVSSDAYLLFYESKAVEARL